MGRVATTIKLLATLPPNAKQKLLSASANALKLCTPYYSIEMSFQTLHKLNARAKPEQISIYKLALQLHKNFNLKQPPQDWLSMNDNICTNSRQVFLRHSQHQTQRLETTS